MFLNDWLSRRDLHTPGRVAVVDDAEPPVGGEAGLWNQRVVAAAYESAETGKAVTV